jgi:Ca2+-binding RTX toxin-like protein
MAIKGTTGNDTLPGTAGDDTFKLWQGGDDNALGFAGNDTFILRDALTAADTISGGSDFDTLFLRGDYSAGLTFASGTITGIELLRVTGAFDYDLTTDDVNVSVGQRLSVNATSLGAGNHLNFDGSAETDGHFTVYGSAGNDTITSGALADRLSLKLGGSDAVVAGDGGDRFFMGGGFDAGDSLDGGAGFDVVILDGGYNTTLGASTLLGIEKVVFKGAHGYTFTLDNGNVAAGENLVLDGSAVVTQGVTINGTAETDGSFTMISNNSITSFAGGAGNDLFDMRLSNANSFSTSVVGGGGDDTIVFATNYSGNAVLAGGNGTDTVEFEGSYGGLVLVGGFPGLRTIEKVEFFGGSYNVTVQNDISSTAINGATSGATVTYDGRDLGVSESLVIDLSSSSSAASIVLGGDGFDTLLGSANSDTIKGGLSRDNIQTNGGADIFIYTDAAESNSGAMDFIAAGPNLDLITWQMNVTVSQVQTTSGNLNDATFDADMAAILGTFAGAAAVTGSGGDLNGRSYLVVDANSNSVYDGGDYVMNIDFYTGTLDVSDFTVI